MALHQSRSEKWRLFRHQTAHQALSPFFCRQVITLELFHVQSLALVRSFSRTNLTWTLISIVNLTLDRKLLLRICRIHVHILLQCFEWSAAHLFRIQSNLCVKNTHGSSKRWSLLTGGLYSQIEYYWKWSNWSKNVWSLKTGFVTVVFIRRWSLAQVWL